eukprot:scpid38219/ scgid19605/ Phospholipase A-2-activating protein
MIEADGGKHNVEMLPFKLSCQLQDHQADVRAVCNLPGANGQPDKIVTTSRDCSAKLWRLDDNSSSKYCLERTFRGHSKYVTAVCALPASDDHPNGLIATGCNDSQIRIYDPDQDDPINVLKGHTGNVCSLVCGKFGTLMSGSWDCTARVWSSFQSVMELKGHTAAIWSVAIMPGSGKHLTASADSTIKIWYIGKCERTLSQHTDCVRSLAVLNGNEFLSASNDGTCRRWLMSGDCAQTYHSHTAFVYSLARLPEGFVSSGEDRTARVWQDADVAQTIPFPTQSVWSVASLSNGDIVAGSSDGIARVFTQAIERMANADELQAFDDQIQAMEVASKSNQSSIGDLQLKDVQGMECLGIPGRTPGESRLVREPDGVYAYQWDAAKHEWMKVGSVENAVDTKTRGQSLDGKEYDYVFSIDVEDGKPALKLGYNRGEDPWLVAQKFLDSNFLPAAYLEQVANFITTNSGGQPGGQPAAASGQQYADPFTGAGRYVPGSGAGGPTSVAPGADPFTGAGRYVPGSAGNAGGAGGSFGSGGAADPFTGTGRYVPGSGAAPQAPTASTSTPHQSTAAAASSMGSMMVTSNEYFPKTTPVFFETANAAGLLKKLTEFNSLVPEDVRFSDEKMAILSALITKLASGGCASLSPEELSCLQQLRQWPKAQQLPGLDALRLAVRHCSQQLCSASSGAELIDYLIDMCSDVKSTNCLLAMRTMCNMAASVGGTETLRASIEVVIALAQKVALECGGGHQIAACTVFLNIAILVRHLDDMEQTSSLVDSICPVLIHRPLDDGGAFRLLVALGTLVCGIEEAQAIAASLDVTRIVSSYAKSETAKVKDCAGFLIAILPQV